MAPKLIGRHLQMMRELVKSQEAVCWLCRDLIDYSKPLHDPESFELDHVIPRSLGGSDDRENLRASHRLCNQRRGNKPATPPSPRRSRDW